MHIQARLPMHVPFVTLNLTLLGPVDLAQKDAGQNQAGDEQDQIDKGKHKSCDAQGSRSGRCTKGRGGESRRRESDGEDVGGTKGNVHTHHRLDGMTELLVGILAGHDAGQDRCDDCTHQANEAQGWEKKCKDPERKGNGIQGHDGDDEATRGGDDIFGTIIGRSHRNSRGGRNR